MDGPSLRKAGILLFLGICEFAFCFVLAEIYYPGYSVSTNYISDLGATCRTGNCVFISPPLTIFNSSIVLLGALPVLRDILQLERLWIQSALILLRALGHRRSGRGHLQRELRLYSHVSSPPLPSSRSASRRSWCSRCEGPRIPTSRRHGGHHARGDFALLRDGHLLWDGRGRDGEDDCLSRAPWRHWASGVHDGRRQRGRCALAKPSR